MLGIVEGVALALVALYGLRRAWNELCIPFFLFVRKAVHVTDIMVDIPERLTVLETRTMQLLPNHGSHLSDDIKETRRLLEVHVVDADTWKTNFSHRLLAVEETPERLTRLERDIMQALIRKDG